MIKRKDLQRWYNEYYQNKDNLLDKTNDKVYYKHGKNTSLFLDELNRASLDVRQASLQLILSKEIHEHKLPYFRTKPAMITACINPEDGYQVEAMDPALYSRFMCVDVVVDVDGWLVWAKEHDVIEEIRMFIMDNRNRLHWIPKDSKNNDSKYPDPRSWFKLSEVLKKIPNARNNPITLELITGKIGESVGARFYNYFKNYDKKVSSEDIEKIVYSQETNNAKEIGELLKYGILKDQNVLFKNELTEVLITKELHPGCTYDTTLATRSMLWALEVESRAALMISMKEKRGDIFKLFVGVDINKELITSITDYIRNKS